ncbi:tRNA 2-thiocytidine biosynthesis protein TtcA [Leclercia adecarboxylata]|uniref:tRNA 2-thiocytidine biosynthesis protein TtcA n=1 Tax=Leclercia adecarboxylata TaxID=83655 RepID=A0A4U9HWD7_9ENTR|nr:tRNA 2-thiocytidine biosynthesis protein TtcA [Leclercia adecarboxylata]
MKAIADFNMIEEGDRIMVCLSGGKDSYTLLEILRNLQQSAPVNFSLVAVNLDQKQPGFPAHILPEYLEKLGVEYKIVEENTYGIVKEKIPEGKTTWLALLSSASGILYRTATELGATKIALGHHRDDILQTLFLNMFYGGKNERHATEADERRREAHCDPSPRLLPRKGYRAFLRGESLPDHSMQPVRAPSRTCSVR